MTREEALEILDTIPTIGEQVDALEMAIEALEQEPCEDAISRQVISDYVESHIQEINAGYGDLNAHTNKILRMIVEYINKIPPVSPVRPKGKWIMRHHIDENRQGFNMWICSECREEFSYDAETGVGITDANFCPNCGADMRGDKNGNQ